MISLLIAVAMAAVPKTQYQPPTNAEILRTARNDLKVEIQKNERESVRFSTVQRGGRTVYLVSYYVNETPLRTQVFPEKMYKKFRSQAPSRLSQRQKGLCIADLIVREGNAKPLRICTDRWPKQGRAEFAKWFKLTQEKLFD